MNARDLITPLYDTALLDQQFPHLTADERLPVLEYEVIEAARKLLEKHGFAAVAEQIRERQGEMEKAFSAFLETVPDDRPMIRTPDDIGPYYGCEDYGQAARAVSKYATNAYLGMSAFDESQVTLGAYTDETDELEEIHFSRTLRFPFTRDQFAEAWSAIKAERDAFTTEQFQEVV